jgi:hypothetical protein
MYVHKRWMRKEDVCEIWMRKEDVQYVRDG